METVNVEMFGKDPKVVRAVHTAKNVSVTKAPVLVVGEAGVGKKSLCAYIHQHSSRAAKPFLVVDCAMDPQDVENQILGHRDEANGRFNKGILEAGSGGSVILANIDCLDDGFQKRLHQVLSELVDYDIDVRIMATTTKNLSKQVGAGRFHRSLFSLVSANTIALPPLRERENDLEYLAKFFLKSCMTDGQEMQLDKSAMDKIMSHYWTHNIHELKTVIEESIGNCENGVLTEEDITIGEKKAVSMISDDDSEGIRLMSLKDAEKLLIKKALIHTSENRTQAAKILGVSIRTLRNKINEYRNCGSTYFVNLR